MNTTNVVRGSEWLKWDLHFDTPEDADLQSVHLKTRRNIKSEL